MKSLIMIPARMASTRLPHKALADIAGKPMIIHVMEQAQKADIGDVIVACDGKEIKEVVESYGGRAIVTDPNLPSGTDRIYAALKQLSNNAEYEAIINVQGDLPLVKPSLIADLYKALCVSDSDITTPIAEIHSDEEINSDAVVKVAISLNAQKMGRALYFSRQILPWGEGPLYHHIGIYAYKRTSLEKFVSLPPSPLELREKLEQLRALENGMTITALCVDEAPWGVDRIEDLEMVRKMLAS